MTSARVIIAFDDATHQWLTGYAAARRVDGMSGTALLPEGDGLYKCVARPIRWPG